MKTVPQPTPEAQILAAMIARIDRELSRKGNVRKDEIRVAIERARREVGKVGEDGGDDVEQIR